METPEVRFQVCDPSCGLVDVVATKRRAFSIARDHERAGCDGVEVFDVMARKGTADTWNTRREVTHRKLKPTS